MQYNIAVLAMSGWLGVISTSRSAVLARILYDGRREIAKLRRDSGAELVAHRSALIVRTRVK